MPKFTKRKTNKLSLEFMRSTLKLISLLSCIFWKLASLWFQICAESWNHVCLFMFTCALIYTLKKVRSSELPNFEGQNITYFTKINPNFFIFVHNPYFWRKIYNLYVLENILNTNSITFVHFSVVKHGPEHCKVKFWALAQRQYVLWYHMGDKLWLDCEETVC